MTPQEKVILWLPTNQLDYGEPADNIVEEDAGDAPVPIERRSLQRSKTPSPSPSTSIHSPTSSTIDNDGKLKQQTDENEKLEKRSESLKDHVNDCVSPDEKDDDKKPLTNVLRNSSASSKSVKFDEDSIETVKQAASLNNTDELQE